MGRSFKVGVFHGFNSGKRNRRGFEDHFNIRGCFDLYCTQGPNTTNTFTKLADEHQHFSVAETGWTALDPLFTPSVTTNNERPTILMCSTFSRNLTCAPILFDTVKQLSQTGKWQWIVQFHPKMEKSIVEKYQSLEGKFLSFVETDNVIPLLQKADVMLCDTSSVLIMFVLQGKPVVTFNNIDPKDYMINVQEPERVESAIENALSQPELLMKNIQHFIEQTHPYVDGKSSDRVLNTVEEMLKGQNLPRKNKPHNVMRQYKMRKELNYWKF